jgi:NAD-dependent dihydropyrimidine dehydrogenase PreA subunit
MRADRKIAHAPRTAQIAQAVARMPSTCIGCTGCVGLCQAMLEVMMLPDVVLHAREPRV